jgi:competence protein ComEC
VREPLILPLACIATGILAGRLLGFSTHESAWPIAAFLILAIGGRGNRVLLPACIGLALFFTGIFAEALHRPGPPPVIDAGSRETVTLSGCVVEPTVFSTNREQFTLELDSDLKARARVTLSLADGDTPQRLDYGQRIEIDARIRRPHNFNNPGSFDYAAFLARQYIYWTATMPRGSTARILPGRCGSRFMSAVFALRIAALNRIEKLYGGDNYSSGMMEAVLIGESSKLEKVWTENFRRTGTFHALVISGVHVTVLAGVLLFLLRLCLLPEMPALAITAASAWVYALVSGFSAPVVRAAGGFTLYLIARFFFRRGRVLNLLAAVALVYLLWDPGQHFDASFQLSFLCVAAIGALATPIIQSTFGPLAKGSRDVANIELDPHLEPRAAQFRIEIRLVAEAIALWTILPLRGCIGLVSFVARIVLFSCEMCVISTVVQIGLALPMAEYFHRVSFSGLTANLLIVPLLNGVVPLGFVSLFTNWTGPARLAGFFLFLSSKIADQHARIEPGWRIADPPVWLGLACFLSLVALAVILRKWPRRWFVISGATAVLLTFALLVIHPFPPNIAAKTLELTAIDVGQGDSLLVAFPDSRVMVIDGGGVLQFGTRQRKPNLNTGEDVVSPYLWNRGIRRVDVLVVTHAHEDHSGGAPALIENFRPREVWVGANPLQRVLDQAAKFHATVIEKHRSDPFDFGGATIEILSPPEGYTTTKAGNNDSLAFRISYGAHSFLLTGDMERPMESRLLASAADLHADVLKLGHHGSKTSTSQPFLDAVSPSIGIVSAGFENSFGHPHRDVMARLADRHSAVLRTDLDGLVTIRTDGRRLTMDTMLWHGESAWWQGERSFNWALAMGN